MTGGDFPADSPPLSVNPVRSAFELPWAAEIPREKKVRLTGRSWSGVGPIAEGRRQHRRRSDLAPGADPSRRSSRGVDPVGRRVARSGVRRPRAARPGHRRRRPHPARRGRLERQRLLLRCRGETPGDGGLSVGPWPGPSSSTATPAPTTRSRSPSPPCTPTSTCSASRPCGATTSVAHTTDNTLRVLDHLGFIDVPVHAGPRRAVRRPRPGPARRPRRPAAHARPARADPAGQLDRRGRLAGGDAARGDRTCRPGGDGPVEQRRGRAGPRPAPARCTSTRWCSSAAPIASAG